MSDDDLRDILARAAREHVPDQARIRDRFERGRAEQLNRRRGRAGALLPGRGSAGVVPLRSLRSSRGWIAPTSWAVAAACAVTAFAISTGRGPIGGGPDVRVATRAAAVATDDASPSTPPSVPATPPLPAPVVTSPDGTPAQPGTTPRGSTSTRPPGPVTTGSHASGADRCDNGARLVHGPYVIANNQWNGTAGKGQQCVRVIPTRGDATGWSAHWTWEGDPATVKAYPSVVRGWHWTWTLPDPAFPVSLDARRTLRSTWAYRLEGANPGRLDVSTIFTLHRGMPSGPRAEPEAEVRVVLSTFGVPAQGPGVALGRVEVPGAGSFDVTRHGPVWTLTSTRAANRREVSSSLDLLAVARLLGRFGLDQSLVVSGVVAGADVSIGTARLVTSDYQVTVR